ncbi:hypothetical protein OnM2_028073, partial [Erysiphe neolycopersici]
MEMVLKKSAISMLSWPFLCQTVAHEIDRGYQPPSGVETLVPSARRAAKKREMKHSSYLIALAKERVKQENAIFNFIAKRERCWDELRYASSWAKQVFKDRHNLGIRKELNFSDGIMVMLYDCWNNTGLASPTDIIA